MICRCFAKCIVCEIKSSQNAVYNFYYKFQLEPNQLEENVI